MASEKSYLNDTENMKIMYWKIKILIFKNTREHHKSVRCIKRAFIIRLSSDIIPFTAAALIKIIFTFASCAFPREIPPQNKEETQTT